MAKIEINSDNHEVIMGRSSIFELICVLHNWAAVVRGDHRLDPDTFVRLDGRKLSHDLERASLLISELMPAGTKTVDLRAAPNSMPVTEEDTAWCDDLARDAEALRPILDRLLGPEVLQHFSYEISNEREGYDLLEMAVLAGDPEAKALAQNPDIGAALTRQDFMLKADQCVPVPQFVIDAGLQVLHERLGPLMERYAELHESAARRAAAS